MASSFTLSLAVDGIWGLEVDGEPFRKSWISSSMDVLLGLLGMGRGGRSGFWGWLREASHFFAIPVAVLRDWLNVWRFSVVFEFPNALRGKDIDELCLDL